MIQKIMNNVLRGEIPDDREVLSLFAATKKEDIATIVNTAFMIRKDHLGKTVKLTSTIHITNQCRVTPKCKYCGFAAGTSKAGYFFPFFKTDREIRDAALLIEQSGIPRVSCSGAHGYNGKHAVKAARIVKENTRLELLVNVGSDLNEPALAELANRGTETVCCNLETTNEALFRHVKPGEFLRQRIRVCTMISDAGIELSSGLLIGIGESYADRLNHLKFLRSFGSLGEIPIMGFNPYAGTPMEHHPACSLEDQIKTIAITRILFPDLRITVPTPTIGPSNIEYPLLAGADNIATVIPALYPHAVKGVGSPVFGSLDEVRNVIRTLGLVPQGAPSAPLRNQKNLPVIQPG